MRTLHKRSLMPTAIGVTAIAWNARVLSGRLVADRGDQSDSGDYLRTSLKIPHAPTTSDVVQKRIFLSKFAMLASCSDNMSFH